MRTSIPRTGDPRKGAAAIEFAMILPVFVLILFGIIEYGWVFFQQANVIGSVRDGTRYAITLPQDGSPAPEEAAESRVRAQLLALGFTEDSLDDGVIQAEIVDESPNSVLVVTVSVPYDPLVLSGDLVPTTITASMTMLLELQE